MNKLTKIGVSALCGSLATVSAANAGSLSVSGGADMSWVKGAAGRSSDIGNPIGLGSNMTFAGSGELDNGSTFALSIYHTNKAAYSSSDLVLTTPSLGTFTLDQGAGGTGLDILDDKMPTAWEESWGTSVGTDVQLVDGVGNSTNIQWQSPKVLGSTITIAHAPQDDGVAPNDKASSGGTGGLQQGTDIVLQMNPSFGSDVLSGLNVFAGYSESEQDGVNEGVKLGNVQEGAAGFTYAYGPVTVGWQRSGEFSGSQTASATEYYDNTAWGVSFNVTDDLAVSYGNYESDRVFVNLTGNPTQTLSIESLQLSYTMGGATVVIADTEVDDGAYTSGTSADREGQTLKLSLAF